MNDDLRAQRRSRTNAISDIFVTTKRSEEAWQRIDDLVEEGWEKEYCKALVLLGPYRSGKTEIVTRYAAARAEREKAEGRSFRWRKVEVPSACTLKGFASAALQQLGDPDPDYGSQVDRTRRIVQAVEELGLDLLIFDEIQRLVDVETERVERKSADWLAGLLDTRCCPLLLVGERKALRVFENNAHLAGRTMGEVRIDPFDWADPGDRKEFRFILHVLDQELGLARPSKLSSEETALRLHIYSEGRVGWVANLLDRARSIVRQRKAPQLTHGILADALDSALLRERRDAQNPFRLNDTECEVLLKRRTGA
jgi:hypothetical protein